MFKESESFPDYLKRAFENDTTLAKKAEDRIKTGKIDDYGRLFNDFPISEDKNFANLANKLFLLTESKAANYLKTMDDDFYMNNKSNISALMKGKPEKLNNEMEKLVEKIYLNAYSMFIDPATNQMRPEVIDALKKIPGYENNAHNNAGIFSAYITNAVGGVFQEYLPDDKQKILLSVDNQRIFNLFTSHVNNFPREKFFKNPSTSDKLKLLENAFEQIEKNKPLSETTINNINVLKEQYLELVVTAVQNSEKVDLETAKKSQLVNFRNSNSPPPTFVQKTDTRDAIDFVRNNKQLIENSQEKIFQTQPETPEAQKSVINILNVNNFKDKVDSIKTRLEAAPANTTNAKLIGDILSDKKRLSEKIDALAKSEKTSDPIRDKLTPLLKELNSAVTNTQTKVGTEHIRVRREGTSVKPSILKQSESIKQEVEKQEPEKSESKQVDEIKWQRISPTPRSGPH